MNFFMDVSAAFGGIKTFALSTNEAKGLSREKQSPKEKILSRGGEVFKLKNRSISMPFEVKIAALAAFLIVHFTAHFKGWYYSKPQIDMLTHLLGGLVLGAFVKDAVFAITLIIAWELMEMLLVREKRETFKEKPLNKISDLLFGIVGYYFGFELL